MNRRVFYVLVAAAAFVIVMMLPLPRAAADGVELSAQGKVSLAVLIMAVILWMAEALPFPITGLVAMVVLSVAGASGFQALVREGFGHEIVLFLIGVMMLSGAINRTGLLRRATGIFLLRFGNSPRMIVLAFLVVGALSSMWISDMAVAAILLPIGVSILKQADLKKRESNFGRALMISAAWGPLIGGVGTPAGCAPNPLTIGYMRDLAGFDLSFGAWMVLGVPAALLMVPFAWLTLIRCFPPEAVDLQIGDDGGDTIRPGRPLTFREGAVLVVLGLAVVLWMGRPLLDYWTDGATSYLSISFVALACGCLLFLPKVDVLTWEEAQSEIDWGGLVLVATGLALGSAVYHTGAARWLATLAFAKIGLVHPIVQVFAVVFGVCLIKVVFSSNTATGVIVVPLMIALSKQIGVNAAVLAIPAGITSSLSFILVTSAPANVITYSSGYFSIRDMARAGIWMTVWASICVTVSIALMGSFAGVEVF